MGDVMGDEMEDDASGADGDAMILDVDQVSRPSLGTERFVDLTNDGDDDNNEMYE